MPTGVYERGKRGVYRGESVKDRFERFTYMEPMSGCWLWMGSLNKNGYGGFKVNGKWEPAHRVSYELYKGPIPESKHVCHHCDIRSCVNPDHFFLGIQKENNQDCISKGRGNKAIGSKNGLAKLTEEDIPKIRADLRSHCVIAYEYGVHKTTIGSIKRNKIWKHIL